jgi:hypothetical protein
LLGTTVSAAATVDLAEHDRRREIGVGGVQNPLLLEALINSQGREPTCRHPCLAGPDRALRPVASLDAVVVSTQPGSELNAVHAASLFASYTYRWVELAPEGVNDVVELEARFCGVGLVSARDGVAVHAQPPTEWRFDQWLWTLQEKVYEQWLVESRAADGIG